MAPEDAEIINELIASLTDGDLFTEREARLILRSVQSETIDGLPDQIERVILWARNVRGTHQVLDLILTLAESDLIAVGHDGTDVTMRLTADPSEVEIRR